MVVVVVQVASPLLTTARSSACVGVATNNVPGLVLALCFSSSSSSLFVFVCLVLGWRLYCVLVLGFCYWSLAHGCSCCVCLPVFVLPHSPPHTPTLTLITDHRSPINDHPSPCTNTTTPQVSLRRRSTAAHRTNHVTSQAPAPHPTPCTPRSPFRHTRVCGRTSASPCACACPGSLTTPLP